MKNKIAIVSVAYNRVHSLARQIDSLSKAYYSTDITLIISIDKSNINDVEIYANTIEWKHGEKRIVVHKNNLGLRKHMLSLGQYLDEFDAIIVLEDDITVTPHFMTYATACIEKYQNDMRIAGISLYNYNVHHKSLRPFTPAKSEYDVYFMNIAMSWGQIWMKEQWRDFYNWYLKNNEEFNLPHIPDNVNKWKATSWLKYHIRYCIEKNKYFVYPYYSLTTNNSDAGIHMKTKETIYQSSLQLFHKKEYQLPSIDECPVLYDGFMEAKYLGKYLGVAEEELTVDLSQSRQESTWKRYLLTTQALPYKVIDSFALELRPIEANIVLHQNGNGIWLYDTQTKTELPQNIDRYHLYHYLYNKGFYDALFMIGFPKICKLIMDLIFYKINQKFNWNLPTNIS